MFRCLLRIVLFIGLGSVGVIDNDDARSKLRSNKRIHGI